MKVDLDFTNVKSNARIRVPEGDYVGKVKKVEKGKSSKKGTPQLKVDFLLMSGGEGAEGKTISDRHYLTEASLWTLRNMLEAMGYNVPAGPMKFTDKMIVGKKVGLTIIDGEEYKGRISSEVADYIPVNVVGNKVSADEAEYPGDKDAGDDDEFGFDDEEEDEEPDTDDEDSEDESDDDDSDDDDDEEFAFDGDDEEEEDEEEEEDALSFDSDDVTTAKAAELKTYFAEATEAGYEFDLPKKAKAADVREALLSIFVEDEEDEEDDDEMMDFDLDDVE